MWDGGGKTVHSESSHSVTADHSEVYKDPYRVAPTGPAKDTKNTIRRMVVPRACWKVEDICFDFDRAFVLPSARKAFEDLANLLKLHKDSPLTIFGHADPVGEDDYNKELSEKRARVVYAVLIRDPDAWIQIHGSPADTKYLKQALIDANHDPEKFNGADDDKIRKAVSAYMDFLAGKLKLEKKQFLGEGAFAYQGCSEFNPVRMFSKKQNNAYKKDSDKTERNQENQPNRRVIAFLFAPGVKVTKDIWPCRLADLESCMDHFFSKHKIRRDFQDKPHGREHRRFATTSKYVYDQTEDTFACRYYYLLSHMSPCEEVRKEPDPIRLAVEDGTWTLIPKENIEVVTVEEEKRKLIVWREPKSGRNITFGGAPTLFYKPSLERAEMDPKNGGKIYNLGPDADGNLPTHHILLHLYGKMESGTGKTSFRLTASVKNMTTGAILFQAEISAQDLWSRSGYWVVTGGAKDHTIERLYQSVEQAKGVWSGGRYIPIEKLKYREVKSNDNLETKIKDLYEDLKGGKKNINARIKAMTPSPGSP